MPRQIQFLLKTPLKPFILAAGIKLEFYQLGRMLLFHAVLFYLSSQQAHKSGDVAPRVMKPQRSPPATAVTKDHLHRKLRVVQWGSMNRCPCFRDIPWIGHPDGSLMDITVTPRPNRAVALCSSSYYPYSYEFAALTVSTKKVYFTRLATGRSSDGLSVSSGP